MCESQCKYLIFPVVFVDPWKGTLDPKGVVTTHRLRTAALGTLRIVPSPPIQKRTKIKEDVYPTQPLWLCYGRVKDLKGSSDSTWLKCNNRMCYANTWLRAWGFDCSHHFSLPLWCPCPFLAQASPQASLPVFPLTVALLLSFLTFVSFQNTTTLWLPAYSQSLWAFCSWCSRFSVQERMLSLPLSEATKTYDSWLVAPVHFGSCIFS